MSIFMKVDNAQGGSRVKAYENWTRISGFEIGARRGVSMTPGRGTYFQQSSVYFTPVSFSFEYDPVVSNLFTMLCKGKIIPKIDIHQCHTGQEQLMPFIKLVLENAAIVSYETLFLSNQKPIEQVVLHAQRITRTNTFTAVDNSKQQNAMGFDVSRQEVM